MGVVKRPYGPWSRAMLAGLKQRRLLKVEAFVSWLAERRVAIDRTLVSHWHAGRSHLPADLLPLLANFTERPDLVFGEYLRDLHCDVVAIPRGQPGGRELLELLLAINISLGRLQHALLRARAPESPGGQAITAEEWSELGQRLDHLIHQLADLRAQMRCEQGERRPRRR